MVKMRGNAHSLPLCSLSFVMSDWVEGFWR